MSPKFTAKLQDATKHFDTYKEIRRLFVELSCKGRKRKGEIKGLLKLSEEEYKKYLYESNWLIRLSRRIDLFKSYKPPAEDYTVYDLISKFGENPVCYLTGRPLNWEYLDFTTIDPHGSRELDNICLVCPYLVVLKALYPVEIILSLMKEVIKYHEN